MPANCSIGALWLIENGDVCEEWDRFHDYSEMMVKSPTKESEPIVPDEWFKVEIWNAKFFIGTGSAELPRVRVLARGPKDDKSPWLASQPYQYCYQDGRWFEQRVRYEDSERAFFLIEVFESLSVLI